jgi:hypothetical protein
MQLSGTFGSLQTLLPLTQNYWQRNDLTVWCGSGSVSASVVASKAKQGWALGGVRTTSSVRDARRGVPVPVPDWRGGISRRGEPAGRRGPGGGGRARRGRRACSSALYSRTRRATCELRVAAGRPVPTRRYARPHGPRRGDWLRRCARTWASGRTDAVTGGCRCYIASPERRRRRRRGQLSRPVYLSSQHRQARARGRFCINPAAVYPSLCTR